MKLSIITVNLNDRQGLAKTLESVRGQTFHDYEHLVIDGGSTDGSAELLCQWAPSLAYACSEPDRGIFHAMNKGWAVSKGLYLLFLNAGDTLAEEDTLQTLFATGPTADIVYGNALAVKEGVETPLNYPNPLTLPFLFVSSIGHQSALIRRDVQLVHPYDETLRMVADWKFFLQCFLEDRRFVFVPQLISRFDATGISSRPDCHALQRHERDAVLLSELGKLNYRRTAAQVALGYLPNNLGLVFKRHENILYNAYCLGRRIRWVQTQRMIFRQRRLRYLASSKLPPG